MSETLPATRAPDPELDRIARLGRWLAASEAGGDVPTHVEMSAALRLYYVQQLGLPPWAAADVSMIRGRLFPQAKLLRALAVRSGYRVVRTIDSDGEACTAVLVRAETGEELGRCTFTMDDAKRAGLVRGGSAWQSHPARMLWARASKFVLDDYAPEITLGLASDDEAPEYLGETRPGPVADVELEAELADQWEPDDPVQDGVPDTLPPPAATESQTRAIHANCREHRVSGRDARLEFARAIVGREITSMKDLTRDEASRLISAFDSQEASTVALLERLADPEPDPEPEHATGPSPAQKVAIYRLLEQRGLDGPARLTLLSEYANRQIDEPDQLTPDEADFVIQMLSGQGQTVMPES